MALRGFVSVCLLAFSLAGAAPALRAQGGDAELSGTLGWKTYVDADFGTAVDYPAELFAVEAGPPPRGSGRQFQTRDGRAKFTLYTLANDARQSPGSYLRNHLLLNPDALDYARVTRRFFAISGVRDQNVFYSRCNFSRLRSEPMRCIFLQYPEDETEAWDDIVTRISLSLHAEASGVGMASSRQDRQRRRRW